MATTESGQLAENSGKLWAGAIRREIKSSKVSILGDYLTNVYWGRNYSGLDAATVGYFNNSRNSLTVAQSLFLATRIASPNTRSERRMKIILLRPAVQNLMIRDKLSLAEFRQICDYTFLEEGIH